VSVLSISGVGGNRRSFLLSPFLLAAMLAASSVLLNMPGCVTAPTREGLRESAVSSLPKDWLALPESDWRFSILPASSSKQLDDVKARMSQERDSAGYHFHQRYSDATLASMLDANRAADAAFIQAYEDRLVSIETIMRHPTPELMNMAERPIDVERNMAVVGNQDLRNMWNDLGRVFLFDQPSNLSPWNTVSTSGQP